MYKIFCSFDVLHWTWSMIHSQHLVWRLFQWNIVCLELQQIIVFTYSGGNSMREKLFCLRMHLLNGYHFWGCVFRKWAMNRKFEYNTMNTSFCSYPSNSIKHMTVLSTPNLINPTVNLMLFLVKIRLL